MAEVEPYDVKALLGGDSPPAQLAIDTTTLLARAYTRGEGFDQHGEPNDELAAVITLAAARLAANATGLAAKRIDDTEYVFSREGVGWTLAERIVLNRYRRKAM